MRINTLKLNYLLVFVLGILLWSCGDDEPTPDEGISSVLVINEGNFQQNNGSFSSFNLVTEEISQGLFEANATIQNVVEYNDRLYIVSNSPDKVDILNKSDLSLIGSISTGFKNPVDFAAVANRGYVTNWGTYNSETFSFEGSFLAVIDLNSLEVIDEIALSNTPQGIIAVGLSLFIASESSATISVLDLSGNSFSEISTAFGPSNFVLDAEGDVWALCTSGSLIEIDPDTKSVTNTLENLTTGGFNERIAIGGEGNIIYFLGGNNSNFTGLTNLYSVDITASQLTATSMIDDGFALYGIGVNPDNGEIYIGDSNAFQSTGTAFRYSSDGTELGSFATGVGPNGFIFR